jgi:regulator of protease activity HflC (stomatin/prohibitin superfamily)
MPEMLGVGGCILGAIVLVIGGLLLRSIRLLYEYERGVIFTWGKYAGTRGPGLTIVIPIMQSMRKVDMRIKTAEIPRQEVMTKDNIPMLVNAVVYFKVVSPEDVITKIENHVYAIRQYTQAALRDVIGNGEMDFVLTEREQIAESIKKIVDAETNGWGVDVESIKIQEVELPAEMKRAMAKQAEAEREKRSKIIHAEGEYSAAQRLVDAAHLLQSEPASIQLRYLQTLTEIGVEKNTTVIFPVPLDLLAGIKQLVSERMPAAKDSGQSGT